MAFAICGNGKNTKCHTIKFRELSQATSIKTLVEKNRNCRRSSVLKFSFRKIASAPNDLKVTLNTKRNTGTQYICSAADQPPIPKFQYLCPAIVQSPNNWDCEEQTREENFSFFVSLYTANGQISISEIKLIKNRKVKISKILSRTIARTVELRGSLESLKNDLRFENYAPIGSNVKRNGKKS